MLWSMLTLEPDREEAGDDIVRHIIGPLSSQLRAGEGDRFRFVRRLEPVSPVVDLHLRAPEHVIERTWKFARALADENVATVGAVKITQSPGVVYPPPGEPVPELLEAPLAYFGGFKGLELAAEISELSSTLALWAVNRFPSPNMRSMLGALLLFDTGHAMMRGPRSSVWADRRTTSWDYFWDAHLRTCVGAAGPHATQVRTTMMAQIAPRVVPVHRIMAALAAETAVEVWRKRWARAVDEYLYRADKQRISRSAQQLATRVSQLALNRLGFPYREQAILGLYARAWSKDIESQYLGEDRSSQPSKR
ncbi:hypothetical protein MUK71_15110 [Arthrobacter zhangbolii]|uniref:Thiopeptide-type bacteriocin biosynthesis domain-containing protein n=1 Tax=Arthrobacter zhangbolii TaxID=2886936 RepID=A0A9X1S981_9MICC|nr:lantibiotic dehydratase C-terminal domain-containing protein [Arthrobacter zhangbolii]MCC3272246.1 hypothetical protein [Arthrobacter zhangbolii]UON91884.1 hypothetical protein MUK71_15110 [Arthrobacter zhangbolii]